jgi:hypothetical protein
MREIKTDLNCFDLLGFIKEIFDFMRLENIPMETVVCLSKDGDFLKLKGEKISPDYIRELLFQEKSLFLPFSDINVGEPIPCADGGQYQISDSGGIDTEVAVSANEVESLGFLAQAEQAMIVISPAVFRGGDYEVVNVMEMEEELNEFSEPMDLFVQRFKIRPRGKNSN